MVACKNQGSFDLSWLSDPYVLAARHYLNQCCLIANWTLVNKFKWKFNQNTIIFIQIKFENGCKILALLSQPQCIKPISLTQFLLLKQKCHFDEIFIIDCTEKCQNDNFCCSQWWKFHQNDNTISVFQYCGHQLLIVVCGVEFGHVSLHKSCPY